MSLSLSPANLHKLITIVSVKLKASNYLIWQMQILPLIQSLQLMNHLTNAAPDSMILKESGDLIPNPKIQEWRNTDLLLRSWITGTLSEEALGHVVGMTTAREVWTSLEVAYLQAMKEREIQLKRQLQMPKKEGTSLGEYLMQFKSLRDSLAAIHKPVSDEDKTVQLSHCLGKKYEVFNTTMLSKPLSPTFNQFITALQGYDMRMTTYESTENLSQALVSTTLSDTQDQDPTWYTDTGATSHMTYDKGTPEQNGIAERKHRHLVHHTSSSNSPQVRSIPSLLGSPALAICPAPPSVLTPAPLLVLCAPESSSPSTDISVALQSVSPAPSPSTKPLMELSSSDDSPTSPVAAPASSSTDSTPLSGELFIDLPIAPAPAPPALTNMHPMLTRKKAREQLSLVALKVTDSTEPKSVKSALLSPHWLSYA
uniref:Retrotransposon Copia-like N-terminal domain-containing protein n=1 Tax=Fagus sylvatica TaxID=28930 RepID=A0A2N9HE41_FAGSY